MPTKTRCRNPSPLPSGIDDLIGMDLSLLKELNRALRERQSVAVVTLTRGESAPGMSVGDQCLVDPAVGSALMGPLRLSGAMVGQVLEIISGRESKPLHIRTKELECDLFVEVHAAPPHLLIVGAGHIAVPLASMAHLCEFQVTVLDDRPQYANQTRFPTADQVRAAPLVTTLQSMRNVGQLDRHTSVVLVTRGHQHDVDCLTELIGDDLAYIGMIGSKRRIRAVWELLESEYNLDRSLFGKVHAPIGLDIGGRTPAEIAVAILAEIIMVQYRGPQAAMSMRG